nr:Na+/H+ antiporter NhaC [Gammaproteobacteria bacterium]
MSEPRPPSLIDALIPLAVLIPLLALSVFLFGADSSGGPNQIVLLLAAAVAAAV